MKYLLIILMLFIGCSYCFGQSNEKTNDCPPISKTEYHSLTGNGWKQVYWFSMVKSNSGKYYATITYDYYNLINNNWVRSNKPQSPTYYLAKNHLGYAIAVTERSEALITTDTCLLKRMIREEIEDY